MTPAPRQDPRSLLVGGLTLLVVLAALWRARYGLDTGDGDHVVALAVRMARGEVPFADEMNAQAMGSVLAVPFTWVWLQLVGTEGIVLASRVWYVALALGAGIVGYRALRTGFGPLAAFTGAVLAFAPTAYNLLLTSYNTVPMLALGTAVLSGYAALRRLGAAWAAVAGGALALSVVSHPSSLPGAAVLGLVLLALALGAGRAGRRVVGGLVGAGVGVSAAVVVWVLVVPGAGAVARTLAYTAAYQELRPHPLARLADTAGRYASAVVTWEHLPAALLLLVLTLVPLGARWRALGLTAVPVLVALPAVARALSEPDAFFVGLLSSPHAVVVALALSVPVARWALVGGTDLAAARDVRLLLTLALPLALVGLVTYAMVTSATAAWGATSPPAMALYGVVGAAVVAEVERSWRSVTAALVAVTLLLGSLATVHGLRSFRDPAVWRVGTQVAGGPHAWLVTTPAAAELDCAWRRALSAWVGPGEGILAYRAPAAYLYADGPMETNIIWLGQFGQANEHVVEWLDAQDRWPDVVVVHPHALPSWPGLVEQDPLVRALVADYGEPVDAGPFTVLRRDGRTVPVRGAEPVGC